MRTGSVRIPMPIDLHLHLRSGDLLERVLYFSVVQTEQAIVMPNTRPTPVLTGRDAIKYKQEIMGVYRRLVKKHKLQSRWQPIMTIQITERTTPKIIQEAVALGVKAGKIYPEGMTNADDGVRDYWKILPVFAKMQELGMIVCLHGQSPREGLTEFAREKAFLETLDQILRAFPNLKVALEHVSTFDAVDYVWRYQGKNLLATITLHHMMLTMNDILGGKLHPHHFCKPVANEFRDKHAVLSAALSGNRRFAMGSDSAPHEKDQKEGADGCAGIFTAPVLIPKIFRLFMKNRTPMQNLRNFLTYNAVAFYGLPQSKRTLLLKREPWQVQPEYGGIVPFLTGQTLEWQVQPK